jgi:hypothetical protein
MEQFGRSPRLAHDGEQQVQLAWLAGLLEAEGTFLQPTPSEPRFPIVACQMTDRDVVERVGSLFGCVVKAIPRTGRHRTLYATRIKGSRAVLLMRDLAPIMGERRNHAIARALANYEPPTRKLDFAAAEIIRDFQSDVSVSRLAREFGVTRPTIRQVLDESIYAAPADKPWRASDQAMTGTGPAPESMSLCELCWLAGWLEGEGSFVRPPPCDPRRPRISAVTTDADVAAEAGRLLRVKALFSHPRRDREKGWSPTWRVLRQGQPAVRLMQALHPLMGQRRRSQIESALAAVDSVAT